MSRSIHHLFYCVCVVYFYVAAHGLYADKLSYVTLRECYRDEVMNQILGSNRDEFRLRCGTGIGWSGLMLLVLALVQQQWLNAGLLLGLLLTLFGYLKVLRHYRHTQVNTPWRWVFLASMALVSWLLTALAEAVHPLTYCLPAVAFIFLQPKYVCTSLLVYSAGLVCVALSYIQADALIPGLCTYLFCVLTTKYLVSWGSGYLSGLESSSHIHTWLNAYNEQQLMSDLHTETMRAQRNYTHLCALSVGLSSGESFYDDKERRKRCVSMLTSLTKHTGDVYGLNNDNIVVLIPFRDDEALNDCYEHIRQALVMYDDARLARTELQDGETAEQLFQRVQGALTHV